MPCVSGVTDILSLYFLKKTEPMETQRQISKLRQFSVTAENVLVAHESETNGLVLHPAASLSCTAPHQLSM